MFPDSIKFTSGQHRGLVFDRGTGPTERVDIGGGVTFLANSTNFWYCGGNRSVSVEYLRQHRDEWTEAPWLNRSQYRTSLWTHLHMDHRYTGQSRREFYQDRFNEPEMTITVTYDDPDQEEEVSFPLPAKYEVCETCNGAGKHVNPSIDEQGLTAEDFAEDPDFEEDYRSGTYDVPCYECQGLRVVPRVDEDTVKKSTEETKLAFEKWQKALEEEDAYRRERESERRYGA